MINSTRGERIEMELIMKSWPILNLSG